MIFKDRLIYLSISCHSLQSAFNEWHGMAAPPLFRSRRWFLLTNNRSINARARTQYMAAASAVRWFFLSFVLRANVLREESTYREIDTCHTHSLPSPPSPPPPPTPQPGAPSTIPRCCRCRSGPPRSLPARVPLAVPVGECRRQHLFFAPRQGKPARLPAWRGKVSGQQATVADPLLLFPLSEWRGVDGIGRARGRSSERRSR